MAGMAFGQGQFSGGGSGAQSSGAVTAGHCVQWVDATHISDAGGACTTGGSGINVTVNAGANIVTPANFQNGTAGNIVNFSNPSGSNIQATLQASGVTNAMLANPATTVNGQTCTLGATCALPFQTNTVANTSVAGINFINSTVNASGLTATFSNPGTNQEKLEVAGTYTGSGTSIGAGTIPVASLVSSATTVNGQTCTLGSSCSFALASAAYANQGTTTTVLHGNAAGNPSFGAVSLTADVSGLLPVANGGNGTASPGVVAGTNITVTGSWPTQTINSTAGGGNVSAGATLGNSLPVYGGGTTAVSTAQTYILASALTGSDGAAKIAAAIASATQCPNTSPNVGCIIDARDMTGSDLVFHTNPFTGNNRAITLLLGAHTYTACVPWVSGQNGYLVIGTGSGGLSSTQDTVIQAGTAATCGSDFPGGTSTLTFSWQHGPFAAGTYAAVYNGAGSTPATSSPLNAAGDSFGGQLVHLRLDCNNLATCSFGYFTQNEEERSGLYDVAITGVTNACVFLDRQYQVGSNNSGGSGPVHGTYEDITCTPSTAATTGTVYGLVDEGNTTHVTFTGVGGGSGAAAYVLINSGTHNPNSTGVVTIAGTGYPNGAGAVPCTLDAFVGTGSTCSATTDGAGHVQSIAFAGSPSGTYSGALVPGGGWRVNRFTVTEGSTSTALATGVWYEGDYDSEVSNVHTEHTTIASVQHGAGTAPYQGGLVKNIDDTTGSGGSALVYGAGALDLNYTAINIQRLISTGNVVVDNNNGCTLATSDSPSHATVGLYTGNMGAMTAAAGTVGQALGWPSSICALGPVSVGGISGLTTGYIPQATSGTAIGDSSPILDNGVTTANTLTYQGSGGIAAQVLAATGSNGGIFGIEGTGANAGTPGAGTDIIFPDSTLHNWHVNANNVDLGAVLETAGAQTITGLKTFGSHASIAATAHGVLLSQNTSAVTATAVGGNEHRPARQHGSGPNLQRNRGRRHYQRDDHAHANGFDFPDADRERHLRDGHGRHHDGHLRHGRDYDGHGRGDDGQSCRESDRGSQPASPAMRHRLPAVSTFRRTSPAGT